MFDFLISNAMAQEAGKAAAQPNPLVSMAPFILIFVVFYFLMIRPQKKKMQQEQEMLKKLDKGDEIYTKSGILGTITGSTDKLLTVEIAEGVKIKILRGEIAGLASKILGKAEEKK